MAELFTLPKARPLDTGGRVRPGSKLTFCTVSTTTPAAIYSDYGCTTQHNNPVVADANGEFAAIYLNAPRDVFLKTSTDTAVWGPVTCLAGESASDISLVPSSGASTTDVQTFIRSIYARTAAEIAASVTPTYYYYEPGDVRRYGAVSGAGNVTSSFASAALVSSSHETYIPPGTWNISGVTFTSGARVRTAGFSTVLTQIAGYDGAPNTLTRLVKITGSNVVFALEGVKVVGQIATDSGEFNHGVTVEASGADIENVTIGDLWGVDLRGDVLYIGGTSGNTVKNVRYGRISGTNILRNIVAITNGVYGVEGVGIEQDGACGYAAYDIEPDTDPVSDIHVGYIRGRFVQIAPTLAADYADRITIGSMDLDPAYGGNTTPSYSAAILDIGFQTRNCRHFYVGNARIKNMPQFAWNHIFNPGELADQRGRFGHLEIGGCGATEATYNAPCQVINMTHIQVDSAVIALESPTTDYAFYGSNTGGTSFNMANVTCDGALVRYADASTFSNLRINTANVTRAFQDVTNSTVSDSNITIPTLLTTGANVTFRNVDATCSTAYLAGTVTDITFDNCSGGLEGVSTPAQWTSNQTDFAMGQGVTDLRFSTDASRNVYSITGGRKGRVVRLFNVGSFDGVLINDDGVNGTAASRLALGASLTIGAGEGAIIWYDSTSSRWRCASRV